MREAAVTNSLWQHLRSRLGAAAAAVGKAAGAQAAGAAGSTYSPHYTLLLLLTRRTDHNSATVTLQFRSLQVPEAGPGAAGGAFLPAPLRLLNLGGPHGGARAPFAEQPPCIAPAKVGSKKVSVVRRRLLCAPRQMSTHGPQPCPAAAHFPAVPSPTCDMLTCSFATRLPRPHPPHLCALSQQEARPLQAPARQADAVVKSVEEYVEGALKQLMELSRQACTGGLRNAVLRQENAALQQQLVAARQASEAAAAARAHCCPSSRGSLDRGAAGITSRADDGSPLITFDD